MREILTAIGKETIYMAGIEAELAATYGKEKRRQLCQALHKSEQLLAALEERLDAIIGPYPVPKNL